MKIEFTIEEAKFIYENLKPLSVPLENPKVVEMAVVGRSVLDKIQTAAEAESLASTAPKQ